MQTASPSPTSRSFQAARATLIASCALSVVGYFVAMTAGDQTPPDQESTLNELAWSAFLIFGAVALLLSVIVFVWNERRASRRP